MIKTLTYFPKNTLYALVSISIVGLALNFLWENLQAPLYAGYTGFIQHLSICSMATLGDLTIILFMYIYSSLIFKDVLWFQNLSLKSVLSLLIIGVIVGVGIEKWALLTDRWTYGYNMPIIPLLGVGLTPVLQMIILPILTFSFSAKMLVWCRLNLLH